MGQTVNLLAYAFGGSNPSLPTEIAEVVAGLSPVFRSTEVLIVIYQDFFYYKKSSD